MAISIALIIMATIGFVYGYDYIKREQRKGIISWCLLLTGILVFCWNFGYGMMGLCQNYEICYGWRRLAQFGVCFFLLVETVYVREITGTFRRHFAPVLLLLTIFAILNFFLVSDSSVVNFYSYKGRTAYSSNPAPARLYQGFFIAVIMILLVSMAIYWYCHLTLRREKELVIMLFFSHFSLVFAMIPDTILPTLGYTSIPVSGVGAFICYLFNVYVVEKLSAFDLSAQSVNDFIYHNAENSILFFDTRHKLIMSNEYALHFFHLTEADHPDFTELFDVSEDDTDTFFNCKNHTEKIRLQTRTSHITCSLIMNTLRDKHNDPTYTACFVYDLTEEERMYNEVNELKQQLQIDLEQKTRQMETLALQSITTIANTIDAKDEYTKGHSERVAAYSVKTAHALGWNSSDIQQLQNAALLHDIGKIGVPDAVLKKAAKITDEEYEIIKQHTVIGADILKDITMIPNLNEGALYHHERFDGKGYPAGLKGKDIPLTARVIAIADSFDAMNTKRVYREPLPKDVIMAELKKNRGTQFDPEILDVFVELYDRGEL